MSISYAGGDPLDLPGCSWLSTVGEKDRTVKIRNLLASMALIGAAPTAVDAAVVNFDLSGDYAASWSIDTDVRQPDPVPEGVVAIYYSTIGDFSNSSIDFADLFFFSAADGGGVRIYDTLGGFSLANLYGKQLYAGSEAMPSFVNGSYALANNSLGGSGDYRLTITGGVNPAVPEPATWGSLVLGMALVGATIRGRRRGNRSLTIA